MELLEGLPLGVGMPVREALRTCQLAPPGHWALPMFAEIGRNDLAASGVEEEGGDQESSFTEGYRHAKEFMVRLFSCRSFIGLSFFDAVFVGGFEESDKTETFDWEDYSGSEGGGGRRGGCDVWGGIE